MRVLVVYSHPCEESFVAAVKDRLVSTLGDGGHEIRVLDLYAMGFDPVLSAQERRAYHTPVENERAVADHLEALRWAEALVFVHPTWWYGPPAILKGWLDRVWVPFATFEMPRPGKPIGRVLTNIRVIGLVTTLGSPRWWWWVIGMPGRRMLLTGLSVLCARGCRTIYMGLHGMDSTTQSQRAAFLDKVASRFRRLS